MFKKTFNPNQSIGSWSFCITYLNGAKVSDVEVKTKIDYRNVLNEQQFALFSKLRNVRKKIAASEVVPPYAIFIDAELAEIAKLQSITLASMKTISGIGEKKVERYGQQILNMLNEESGAKCRGVNLLRLTC
ncbi:MAG: HRDC domain-containing protein [Muribaculaceae bacterium]|nr:HRDC domain-containing protein [Muribaculaceae bacterium]